MTTWRPEVWIAIWLMTNLFLVGIYDVIAASSGNGNGTISSVIYTWVIRWPLLGAAVGGLVVHLLGLTPRETQP